MKIKEVLTEMVQRNASDVFIKALYPPSLRIEGNIVFTEHKPLTAEDTQNFLKEMAAPHVIDKVKKFGEADFAYSDPELGRFRVNASKEMGKVFFVLRHIKSAIRSFEDLNLPIEGMSKLASQQRGLILVTGTAGSGKSTTLASMIEYINEREQKHVITIEDPIEFMFRPKKSIITQREVGLDTTTFFNALRMAVRQSPDVILIGEMRDRETMEVALSAAETGHLVLSTLHTINAVQTVERIINFFPPHQHGLIRLQLSLILAGIVSQRLVTHRTETARVPAVEMLVATPLISELLAEGKTRELWKAMQEDDYYGNQTFYQSLKTLYQQEKVSLEDALKAVDNPDELKMEIKGIIRGSKAADFNF